MANDRSAGASRTTTWLAIAALVVSVVGTATSLTLAITARQQAANAQKQLDINERSLAAKFSVSSIDPPSSSSSLFGIAISNAGTIPFRSVSIYFVDYNGKPVTDYYDVGTLPGCTEIALYTGNDQPQQLLVAFTDANGLSWSENAGTSTAKRSNITSLLPSDVRDWSAHSAKVTSCA